MKHFILEVSLLPNVLIWLPKYTFQKIMQRIYSGFTTDAILSREMFSY